MPRLLRHRILRVAARSLLCLCLFSALPALAAGRPVLLISIDGLRPQDVLQPPPGTPPLPQLRALARDGMYAEGVVGVLPTLTYPSHVTLLTGTWPRSHGIGGNLTFDPYNKNQQGWAWYASDIRVPTLWQAAHAAGLRTANVHWPVSVGAPGLDANLPQIWRTGTDDDRKLLAALATPGLLPALEAEVGIAYPQGIDESLEADAQRARFALALIRRERPQFMTVYFAALDHEEHAQGAGSAQAWQALQRLDALVGQLRAAWRQVHPDGVLAVVSDHGFGEVQHDVNLYVPFLSAGLVTLQDGQVKDWQAMPWNQGGSAAVLLRDPADAALRAKVEALLRSLQADPGLGIATVLDRRQVAAKGGSERAEWFVVFAPGYEMAARVDAPLVGPAQRRGMHGYDPARLDQRASFFLAGPGIAAGQDLGVIDMRAIAPTLAALLGSALPGAEAAPLSLHPPSSR
ncbi:MAG: alkaline phosphatase family protein [Thermomonas haemolytica]